SGADAKDGEKLARYKLPRHGLHSGAPNSRMKRRRLGKREYFCPALERIPEALEHRKRDGLDAFVRADFMEQVELLRIAHRKQTQQHGVEQAEHGGVGADAERERHHNYRRERGVAADDPQRVPQILDESFERWPAPNLAARLSQKSAVAELPADGGRIG